MNKRILSLIAAAALLFSAPAFADLQISNNGTRAGQFRKINLPASLSIAANGDITSVSAPLTVTTLTATTVNATTASATTLNAGVADAANSWTSVSNGIQYEGATADASETTLSVTDPTADRAITLPDAGGMVAVSSLTTNAFDAANGVNLKSNGIEFEGATADAFETTLSPVDPTADETASIPNFAVNFALMGSTLTTNTVDAANSVWGISNSLVFEGATADAFETTLTVGDPTADQTVTIPATAGAAGTVRLTGATVVITAGTTPTLTVPLGVDFIATDTITTDNQDQTITFSSGGSLGQQCTMIFQTDSGGSNDEVITLHTTLTNTTGTLTLANLTANRYVLRLVSDGTVWNEVSRTGAQT